MMKNDQPATQSDGTLGIGQLLKALWQNVPAAPSAVIGLWKLLSLSPGNIGSIGASFAAIAKRHPDRPALIFDGRRWTYAELNAWANRCAWALNDAGIRSGDSVGIMLENRAEALPFMLGIVKLGAVACLFNHQQRGDPLVHSLRVIMPKIVLVGQECAQALQSLPRSLLNELCPQWWWDGEQAPPDGLVDMRMQLSKAATGNPPQTDLIRLHQPCFNIFTSGTTGLPKASVMSHYRWHRCMYGMGELGIRLRAEDVLFCPLPLYHNNAMTVAWSAVIAAGACIAIGKKFSASSFWSDIRRNGATSFCYIGELCRYLLNQPERADDREHGVRAIIGNGLRPDIWHNFQQRFAIERIAEFYAASECNLAFVNALGLERTAGFCPMPFAIVEFDVDREQGIRKANGRMKRVARGGVGLLLTKITKRAPLDGYTDEQATEAKILRDVFAKGDAWFNSGDLVRRQGFGHIQFVDRVGDTFRWKGENVATTEVEAAFGGLDYVEEVVVYGVEVPGSDGRAGMAALRLRSGNFDGVALARTLRQVLPKYAVPLFLRLRDEHDVTATFKYSKVQLKHEGCNPNVVSETLLILTEQGYERLTAEKWSRLSLGSDRFD